MYNKNNLWYVFFLTIIVLLFPILKPITYNWNGEDCYITYRVAENFSEGHGLVFNKEQFVETHSNFLWTAILGIFHKFGLDTQNTSKILSVISVSMTIFLLGFIRPSNYDLQKHSFFELTAPLLYLLHPNVHYQCDMALETSFYTFLIVLGVYFAIRFKLILTSIIFSLVATTRPEGFGFFIIAVFIVSCLFIQKSRQEKWNNNKKIILCACLIIPFSLIFGVLEIWRLSTYGYLFPNPVYAKTSSLNFWYNSSVGEVYSFIISWNFLPLIVFFTLWRKNNLKQYILILFCFIFAVLVYIISIGTVATCSFRHYIPMIPFIVLLLQEVVLSAKTIKVKFILAILLLCFTFYTSDNKDISDSRLHVRLQEFLKNFNYSSKVDNFFCDPQSISSLSGIWLKNNFDKNTRVISGQMGQLAYFSDLYMIDLLGLADSHVAHCSFTLDYAISQNPDIWAIICYNDGSPAIPDLNKIILSKEFNDKFFLRYILTNKYDNYQYRIFMRHSNENNTSETLILSPTI